MSQSSSGAHNYCAVPRRVLAGRRCRARRGSAVGVTAGREEGGADCSGEKNAVRALTRAERSAAEDSSRTNEGALKQRSMGAVQGSLVLGVFSFPLRTRELSEITVSNY